MLYNELDDRGIKKKKILFKMVFHFKSWANIKSFKTKLIKYEDLQDNAEEIFKNTIFFNNLINNGFIKNDKALDTKNLRFEKR